MALETIGAGLEIAGGLKNLFGKSGPSPWEQSFNSLKGAFEAADQFGIHRLAVAGSPAGYSPVPSMAAEGAMQAGQALTDYAQSKGDKSIQRKQEQLVDAQIQEARSRTILNQANARRAVSGPQPGLGQATNRIAEALDRLPDGGPRGVRDEPQPNLPARQKVTIGDKTAVGPNPEAFEVGISELIAGALIYGPQWLYDQMGGGSLDSNRSGGKPAQGKRPGAKPWQPGYR